MDGEALFSLLSRAAQTVPALIAARRTARSGRLRPARWLALAFIAAALIVFGWATRQGQDTAQSLPGVLLSGLVLVPAAFAAVVGGLIGRAWGNGNKE